MEATASISSTAPLTRQARLNSARGAFLRKFRTSPRCERGVSAVEFALFAPILFFALLAMTDLGFALYERMTIDHVLRDGVQKAHMHDPGRKEVYDFLVKSAANDPLLADSPPDFFVDHPLFSCPEDDPRILVSVQPTCADDAPPYIYYRLSAEKNYDGIFMPISIGGYELVDVTLRSLAQVQVR